MRIYILKIGAEIIKVSASDLIELSNKLAELCKDGAFTIIAITNCKQTTTGGNVFNANWHSEKAKGQLRKAGKCPPDKSQKFSHLKDIVEFSKTIPDTRIYVNWERGKTGYIIENCKKQTHKL